MKWLVLLFAGGCTCSLLSLTLNINQNWQAYILEFKRIIAGHETHSCHQNLQPEVASLCRIIRSFHTQHPHVFKKVESTSFISDLSEFRNFEMCINADLEQEHCLTISEDDALRSFSLAVQKATLDSSERDTLEAYQDAVWWALSLVRGMRPHHPPIYALFILCLLIVVLVLACLITKKWSRF